MPLDVFELTSRQSLAKTSGIVLDRDSLPVFQAIEQQSTRGNIGKGFLFTASTERLTNLKVTPERFREIAKSLIEFKLVAQVFEVVYSPDSYELELVTYFVCETESLRDVTLCYDHCIEKSTQAIYSYCKEKSIANPIEMHRIAYQLGLGQSKSFGMKLQSLFGKGKFIVIPSDSYIKQSKSDIRTLLEKYNDLIGDIDTSLYYVAEEVSDQILMVFRSEFEAKLLPFYRLKEPELDSKIQAIQDQESVLEKNVDYRGEWEFLRKLSGACLEFPKLLGESGRILVNTIVKLSILAENYNSRQEKITRDQAVLKLLKEMEKGDDIDSLFPRINLEDPEAISPAVVDALKVDREVLHAEWFTPQYKLIVFARKNPERLRLINQIIHDQFKNNTEYILYFRALLEANEKDVFEVFQSSEFLKTYGKSLQVSYLKYIPFIYKIFAWLGIRSLTNAGYTKAKSIIKYHQMDRQFQYEKRSEKRLRERMEARAEELAKKELEKYKVFLVNALEDFYFYEKIIPTAEDIGNQYPALIPLILEKVTKEYHFGVAENGGFASGNIIFFPRTEAWEEKNSEVLKLAHSLLSQAGSSQSELVAKAELLKKALS